MFGVAIGAILVFWLFGAAWARWGGLGALIFLGLILIAIAYVVERREAGERAGAPSAPTAELPVVDLDLGQRAKSVLVGGHERIDSFPIRRLNGQGEPDRLTPVERGERSVQDQTLQCLSREGAPLGRAIEDANGR